MSSSADLILSNARVLTMDDHLPHAGAVAIRGETIVAVGNAPQVAGLKGGGTRVIDCQGMTLLPGFVDAHCHLLALAASLTAVDCSADKVRNIHELKREVQLRAGQTPPGHWIRGYGYDERSLAEGRHPTRWDLDAVAPRHPVRLDHRSGHAVVLNSLGLELAGIHRETPDPVEGVIQRDGPSGQPTGVLLEMTPFLRSRLGGTRDQAQFEEGIARLDGLLLGYGITSAQDAGPDNGLHRWSTFRNFQDSGRLACRVTMMAGAHHTGELLAAGLNWGAGNDRLRLGHAKIMLTLTTGALHPDFPELEQMLADAHQAGFPVAIHAVEEAAVVAAAEAFYGEPTGRKRSKRPADPDAPLDRIEHCSECPPELIARVHGSGAMVVTQPGFIYWNGEQYLSTVAPGLLPHLYPIGALYRAGVPLAFGSDAPVIGPNPWPAICAAVTRLTRMDHQLPGKGEGQSDQRVPVLDALKMYTLNAARAEGTQDRKGSIRPGKLADLILVDADPTRIEDTKLKDIKAVLTVLGGKTVWDRSR